MGSKRCRLAPLVLAVLGTTAAAGEIDFHGFGFIRGIGVGGQSPWIEGGFGRLTEGADAPGATDWTGRAMLHVGIDWKPVDTLLIHVHGLGRAEPEAAGGERFGIPEGFIQFQPELSATLSTRLRAGLFFPGTSLENTEPLWMSPYTITLSALNTWTGEELRLAGLEGRLFWSDGRDTLHVGGTGFLANDTLGTLIAWRGWSMSDRFTVAGELLPLPPLFSLEDDGAFFRQRDDGTRPIDEIDDRVGWMARAGWERLDRVTLQAAYFDNGGDRKLYEGQYSWDTRFWVVGAKLNLGHGLELLAEGMLGNTLMGEETYEYDEEEHTDPYGGQTPGRYPYPYPYPTPYPNQPTPAVGYVDMDFATAYGLLTWQRSQFRVSLRYDWFENQDNDGTAEDTSEDGQAVTVAAFWTPIDHLRIGAEYLDLRSQRKAAEQSGADPDTDAWKATLEARISF
jgi:hypothetical protein